MVGRLLTLFALAALLYVPAAGSAPLAAPTGLHPFYLRVDDPAPASYPRTPSFAWQPYEGAASYDFQLATSSRFDDRTIFWSTDGSSQPLRVPTVSVPIALPWMTGRPYALYVRVRAHLTRGVSRWSVPFGFNTQGDAPDKLSDVPGLVRWTPIAGATSYQVWFQELGKVISTATNVADEREYYTGHQDPTWSSTVTWRVRAVRQVYGNLPNGLPRVTYGPWSNTFLSQNPSVSTGTFLSPVETVSDVITANSGVPHHLMPGFAFNGDYGPWGSASLYRVYVSTDRQCVNVVFTGSVVGSPAYAPRTSGPIQLPDAKAATTTYLTEGAQPAFSAEGFAVTPTDQSGSTATPGSSPTTGAQTTTGSATAVPSEFTSSGPFVDLWDLGRPNARYWWTVVPVQYRAGAYRDDETPQDACAAGKVMEFAKTGQATTTSSDRPFASGLSRFGELAAARTMRPSFSRGPLVAWEPTRSAVGYEVQWSRTRFPFQSKGSVFTAGSSVLLDQLAPGTWYYRVRGINPLVPGPITQMAWSTAVQVTIAKPRFFNESNVAAKRVKK